MPVAAALGPAPLPAWQEALAPGHARAGLSPELNRSRAALFRFRISAGVAGAAAGTAAAAATLA